MNKTTIGKMEEGRRGLKKGQTNKGSFKKGQHPSPETEFKKGNKNRLGVKLSEETKRKIRRNRKGKGKGTRNPLSEETKKKMRKPKTIIHRKNLSNSHKISQKKKWQEEEYRTKQLNSIFKGLELKPNKPEKVMIDLIKKNNLPFNYVGDGKIWFRGENNSFNPDFLSKNPKHIIELFGDYWHNRLDAKQRDKERLETYNKYGYNTLVIWEHELKNTLQVLNKIKRFCNL